MAFRLLLTVIFMEDHIPIRPDRSLLLGRETSKWSLWDVVFHENNSTYSLSNSQSRVAIASKCKK